MVATMEEADWALSEGGGRRGRYAAHGALGRAGPRAGQSPPSRVAAGVRRSGPAHSRVSLLRARGHGAGGHRGQPGAGHPGARGGGGARLPDVAGTALLEEGEWPALACHLHQPPHRPPAPPPLAQAVRGSAPGGFLGRTGDGPPGVTVLWRAFQRLGALTAR